MPPLLLKFAGVDFKRVTIIGLSMGIVLLYAYIHVQNLQYKTAYLVYQNPQRITKTAKRKETGAVRIITRYVERPSGERETTIEETRGPVIETDVSTDETRPISIAETLAPFRTDRYLLTFGVNRLTWDKEGKAILVGYGFKNRFDLQAGVIHRNETSPWVFATARF